MNLSLLCESLRQRLLDSPTLSPIVGNSVILPIRDGGTFVAKAYSKGSTGNYTGYEL